LAFFPIYKSLLRQQLSLTQNLLESNIDILQVLGSAIAKRDSNTDSHNYRVTIYAVSLAEAIRLKYETIQSLIKGAFLHDVGKIGISDNILLKPGKLNEEEFKTMKKHVQHGIDIVKRSEWLKDAADIVECHHKQFGGDGYPLRLKGQAISIGARIFAIADVFDTLTSRRPYKESFSYQNAISLIKVKSGINFDPDLVDMFISIIKPIYLDIRESDSHVLRLQMADIINKYFTQNSGNWDDIFN
jgi:putative nucleotidyltransferase with HDIG domain